MRAADKPFDRVYALVKKIPRGKVATYGALSQIMRRRLTPLAVGWALQACRDKKVPWHRVVNSKGSFSTSGNLQKKLLAKEGVTIGKNGRVDLERYGWRPS